MKVVINICFGGFGLSREGVIRYLELAGKRVWPQPALLNGKPNALLGDNYWLVPPSAERPRSLDGGEWATMSLEERQAHNQQWNASVFYDRDLKRDDPLLVRVVEEMGPAANGKHANLRVVEIPDDVQWEIDEYHGSEHVAEVHRTWR